jgi:hypothetical protein
MADKTKTQHPKNDKDKELGIHPMTYGLGVAAKYTLALYAVLTSGLFAIATLVFKPDMPGWRNRAKLIHKVEMPKHWLEFAAKWVKEKASGAKAGGTKASTWQEVKAAAAQSDKSKDLWSIFVAAFGLSVVIAHILQGPAIIKGRRKAQEANAKYDEALDENTRMAEMLAQRGETVPLPDTHHEKSEHEQPKKFAADVPPPTDNHTQSMKQPTGSHARTHEQRQQEAPAPGLSA